MRKTSFFFFFFFFLIQYRMCLKLYRRHGIVLKVHPFLWVVSTNDPTPRREHSHFWSVQFAFRMPKTIFPHQHNDHTFFYILLSLKTPDSESVCPAPIYPFYIGVPPPPPPGRLAHTPRPCIPDSRSYTEILTDTLRYITAENLI